MLTKRTLWDIQLLTARNDHCGALIVAGEALELTECTERVKVIQRRQLELGHLPHDLYRERYGIYQEVLAYAKKLLSRNDYQQFYMCF